MKVYIAVYLQSSKQKLRLTQYLPSSILWDVRQKFLFQFMVGSSTKIPMSVATMSL